MGISPNRRVFLGGLASVGLAGQAEAGWSRLNLNPDERVWLKTAFGHLREISDKRSLGKPRDYCFCVFSFEPANIYIQFLARPNEDYLLCEAVSAEFTGAAPEIEAVRVEYLSDLGFSSRASPNYSQAMTARKVADLNRAAWIALFALKDAYRVRNFGEGKFKINIPSSRLALPQKAPMFFVSLPGLNEL